mmetsp:Transcript_63501/g.168256  ORF Transcript_63501/g.168256 Transcript_63501/m.168256 type:complete len:102 (-) Transcript_63501:1483-1788(-)
MTRRVLALSDSSRKWQRLVGQGLLREQHVSWPPCRLAPGLAFLRLLQILCERCTNGGNSDGILPGALREELRAAMCGGMRLRSAAAVDINFSTGPPSHVGH